MIIFIFNMNGASRKLFDSSKVVNYWYILGFEVLMAVNEDGCLLGCRAV
jgi:hypothetical protein